jgi:AmiR/NasT family two-component response regulator
MKKESISESQAYQRIQKMSMKKNIPMKDIAQAIVITNE